MKRTKPASSFDVADLARVSRATVSHILNGRGLDRFPQETRDRVLAAAAQLDYRPSPAARSLVKGRSDTIVVLASNTTWGRNLQDAVDQITVGTAFLGSNVVIRFAGQDPQATVNAVLDLRPFAVVDLGFLSEEGRASLRAHNVVTVPSSEALSSAAGENGFDALIVAMQVEALVANAPRRLVFAGIADERQDLYGPRRYDLLCGICEERGFDKPLMVRVPTRVDEARNILESLPTGVSLGFACYNDDVALAVLAAARDSGRTIPDDVAVAGVDATEVGQLWFPRLTTIEVDIRRLMDASVGELRVIAGESEAITPTNPRDLIRLIVGQST
jgi:DNA-binding LacI/PurR family transcriptional regulator